jgi:Site-specific DNA methylase
LEGRLGYKLFVNILNGKDFGLPQSRERFYLVGFRENVSFTFPKVTNKELPRLDSILEENVDPKYYLSEKYLTGLEKHKERHRGKGHGFGYEILDPQGIAHTLVAGNMGRERNLIKDKLVESYDHEILTPRNKKGVRKLTVREYARLQGFPDSFVFPVSDNQAYKQIGNSVCVPVVHAIAKKMKKVLESTYSFQQKSRFNARRTYSELKNLVKFRLLAKTLITKCF